MTVSHLLKLQPNVQLTYGRKNKLKTPTAMAAVMKANTVFKSAADRMKPKELEGKIVVGEFANILKS